MVHHWRRPAPRIVAAPHVAALAALGEGAPMISLITTYYNQPRMLARQLHEWANYPEETRRHFRFVIVDDGSSQPASDVLLQYQSPLIPGLMLYRIDTDIPWNQHGARNLAAMEADVGDWLLMLDIDHVLTAENAARLVDARDLLDARRWYRFPRERIGAADDTRTKDLTRRGIDPTLTRAPVNPATNCFLVKRANYWAAGGYNEDFCGCYGGDSQFLSELTVWAGPPVQFGNIWLQVHTRDSVPDANTSALDRSPEPFRQRLEDARLAGTVRGHEPYCRFSWRRVL